MPLGALLSSANTLTTILLALGGVVVLLTLLRRWPYRRKPGNRGGEQRAHLRAEQDVASSMNELLVQLGEMSHRVSTQADATFAKLAQSIRDADERISRLEAILAQVNALRSDLAASAARADRRRPAGQTGAKAPAGRREDGDGQAKPTTPQMDKPAAQRTETPDDRYQRVYQLADDGLVPIRIAEDLGMTLGEVELVLNLREFR